MFDPILDAVDFSSVAAPVLAIGALIAVALVAGRATRMVLDMMSDRQDAADQWEEDNDRFDNY